jgi:predicted amidohydrolase YtcJ
VIARRIATTPPGQFICCHLGWHYVQLAENRPPTKAELDAAAPNNPVYISGRAGDTPTVARPNGTFAMANSLAVTFFQTKGISVDATTGNITSTPEQCLIALKSVETREDDLRETYDNNAWTNSLGVTTIFDSPAGAIVTARDYPALELWRQGKLNLRHRYMCSASSAGTTAAAVAAAVTTVNTRMQNIFRLFGDDLLKVGGFGETIGSRTSIPLTFEPVARAIATGGWKIQNHTDFSSEIDDQITAFQSIAATIPLDQLRWQLIHVFTTNPGQLQTLKDLGVGVDLENERYLDRLGRGAGPFFRSIVDSGINIGMGTDGSNFAPNNPWLMMYYATTGVNVWGDHPGNASQVITRLEALRLFTAGSAFQTFNDDKGSFDVGKVADLAVLNQNFLTVSDAQLRKTRSVMTIVGGKIVHEGDVPQYTPIGQAYAYTGT